VQRLQLVHAGLLLTVMALVQTTYDAGQGSIAAPGCLAATPIEAPITVEDGYPTQVSVHCRLLVNLL